MKNISLLVFFLSICNLATAQKKVLFEKFTNAYCGVCPDASLLIKDIVDENPNAIWISHHKPVTFTDNLLTNEKSIALWNDLNIAGVPTGMIDRKLYNNSISISRSQWKNQIEEKLTETASFDINISDVSFDLDERELQFNVEAIANDNVSPGSYRITTYIVEDSVYYRQHSYFNDETGHPLEGLGDIIWGYPHMNVVRTILDDDHMGTKDLIPMSPEIGTPYGQSYSYTAPDDQLPKNMKIVAMVSLYDEENNYPGEIQNATRVILKDLDIQISSTSENEVTHFFEVSPNPTRDYLYTHYTTLPQRVILLDTQGKRIKEMTRGEKIDRIDVSDLDTGIYFLRAEIDNIWVTKHFMVVK